ncbi:MAG: hypothetical protein QNK37_27455 [Acidobacteriota bacterium]|nr:hypothetical protein [Acidobacteriota bacterium]
MHDDREVTVLSRNLGKLISRAMLIALAWSPVWAQLKDLEVHGFISQGYLESSEHDIWAPTRDGTFEFSEIGLNLSKRLGENLRVGLQLFARDLGDLGNHEVELDWAIGEYRWGDTLGFRIGKIKQPYGFYNQERDIDLVRPQIFLPQSVYPEGTRDLGLAFEGFSMFGTLPGNLDYELYVGVQDFDADSPGMRAYLVALATFRPFTNPSLTSDRLLGGAVRWDTPLEGLTVGISYYTHDFSASMTLQDGSFLDIDVDGNTQTVLSLEYQANRWSLMAESSESTWPEGSLPGEPAGWYIGGTYRLDNRFELNANHNEFYSFKDDKDGTFLGDFGYLVFQKDSSLGVRIDISESWLLKAEWHEVEGLGLSVVYDLANVDNIFESDWHYFGVKATFHF